MGEASQGEAFLQGFSPSWQRPQSRKLVSLQRSAANQATVNIGLAEQLLGVLRIHAAAVLDGQALGSVLAVQLANHLADSSADLLGLSAVAVLPVPMAQMGS